MTVTNISQSPVTFDLFTYVDVDLCGAANNTADAVNNDGTRQFIRNQSGCANDTNVEPVSMQSAAIHRSFSGMGRPFSRGQTARGSRVTAAPR